MMPHHPSCNPLLMPTPASLISSHLLFWKSWIKALGALAYNTATNYFFIFVWQAMENKNITSSSNFHSCWIDFGRWMILTNCSHAATLYIISSFAHWDFTFVLFFSLVEIRKVTIGLPPPKWGVMEREREISANPSSANFYRRQNVFSANVIASTIANTML